MAQSSYMRTSKCFNKKKAKLDFYPKATDLSSMYMYKPVTHRTGYLGTQTSVISTPQPTVKL